MDYRVHFQVGASLVSFNLGDVNDKHTAQDLNLAIVAGVFPRAQE